MTMLYVRMRPASCKYTLAYADRGALVMILTSVAIHLDIRKLTKESESCKLLKASSQFLCHHSSRY
jgi:hypothetical protein